MKFFRTASLVLTLAALSLSATACMEEVPEINRVQANYIKKADLRGVWYEVDVVTDIPLSAAFGFAGQANFGGEDGGKVLFDIQEKYVVVYPYTEKVLGGDAKWNKRKVRTYWKKGHEEEFIEVVVGNPTGMYPISGHFDIRRQYSSATGAQDNVLVENTEQPWWKREYMRVDWSTNQLQNVLFPLGTMKYSNADYYVPDSESDNPNKFYMAPEGGYFHFTRRLFAEPMSTGTCSVYSLAPGDCSGAVVEVRLSFRRASPRKINDYEIRNYHNRYEQDKFGFFLADRYRFDEDFGLTYTGHDYKAARWNLWEKSKSFTEVKDAAGKPIACLTNRDCSAPAVCDQADWFEPGTCKVGSRLEYSQRGFRPIVYHVSADHPLNHMGAAYATGDSWSDAFKDTASWLLFWEKKWAVDKTPAFTDPQSRFGQRFCQTHADCSGVATSATDVDTTAKANRVLVGLPKGADGKDQNVLVEDCVQGTGVDNKIVCTDRASLAGATLVAFVNASPATPDATLDGVDGGPLAGKFKAGKVNASTIGRLVPTAGQGTKTLTIKAGAKSIDVPNVRLQSNETVFVVLVGGDKAVVLRGSSNKMGLRVVNGLSASVTADGLSDGPAYELGVNGVRMVETLPFGRPTDYLYSSGTRALVAFVAPGHRTDTTCSTVSGVGMCIGWRQKLSDEDLKQRETIKQSLPDLFVVCENKFTRTKATCDAAGQTGKREAQNDCRYWIKKTVGGKEVDHNPCADVTEGGFVPHAKEKKIGGDMRYNYLYWVTNIHASSPLGYGPSAADPDTGEIIWATANVYGASQITYSQYAKDLVDLLNGDLDPKDLATGKYIREYVLQQSQSGKDKSLFEGALPQMGEDDPATELERAKRQASIHMIDRAGAAMPARITAADEKFATELQDPKKLGQWLVEHTPSFDIDQIQKRMEKVKGSPVERAMINDEMALVMSEGEVQPGEAIGPEQLGRISPVGWATPKRAMDEKLRMQFLGINSITLSEFQDPSLIGLAKRMKCQPGQKPTDQLAVADGIGKNVCYKGDALRTALSVALYKATLEHEVGHTVGLRHNFSGSTDLMNYFDPYFDEATGREKEPILCADLTTPSGKISADDFCETDSLGEQCVLRSCSATNPCPGGLACAKGQCVDADGVAVGTCHSNRPVAVTCANDGACGDGLCVSGKCEAKVSCKDASKCLDGETCDGGFCIDPRTKKPRSVAQTINKPEEVRKYRSRPGYTEKEQNNRRFEYQYSTVMDYGQKIHTDIYGLGKYDYAAIKYGYGEMVEVYSDPSYLIDTAKLSADVAGRPFADVSWRLRTGDWRHGGLFPLYNYVNDWMPHEFNKRRETVPAFFVDLESENAINHTRQESDVTYFEVPYKYCSDEFRGGSMGCYYFDAGTTMEEIVYQAGEALEEYYIFDAFKRERLFFGRGGSPASYMARIQDRWLTPIGAAGRYYAIYNNIYRVFSWFPSFDNRESYLGPMQRASKDAFRRLTAMIATPAPGSYVFDKASNTYTNVSYDEKVAGSELDIPLGRGKFPWTSFATQKGYYYYDHPMWIGAYWDKIAAILEMTNSTFYSSAEYVGEQLPVFRATAIGFNTIYPEQLSAVLGGLAAGDISTFAGTVRQDGTSSRYEAIDPFHPPAVSDKRVQPSVLNTSLRVFAAWQAIANLPAGFDPSYTDAMAVWLKGSGHQYKIGEGQVGGETAKIETCEFVDPFGQKTYVTLRPNYSVTRYSPTFAMCQKLNRLKTGCSDGSVCTPCASGDTTCTGVGLCADKSPCKGDTWLTKANGAAKENIATEIKKELEVLDYFRMLYAIYGAIGSGAI